MTEMPCDYGDRRDEAIVALLYIDQDAADMTGAASAEQARFETHVQTCARCRAEVAAPRGVRAQLARWAPPEPSFAVVGHQPSGVSPASAGRNPQWWRSIPVWAQVAAAMLVLGVSAGIANLDVHYDQNGLSVGTGWSDRAGAAGGSDAAGRSTGTEVAQGFSPASAPWKADI